MRFCKESVITVAQPSSGNGLKARDVQEISRVKAGRTEEVHSTQKGWKHTKAKGGPDKETAQRERGRERNYKRRKTEKQSLIGRSCVTVGNQQLREERSLQITGERDGAMEWLSPCGRRGTRERNELRFRKTTAKDM